MVRSSDGLEGARTNHGRVIGGCRRQDGQGATERGMQLAEWNAWQMEMTGAVVASGMEQRKDGQFEESETVK